MSGPEIPGALFTAFDRYERAVLDNDLAVLDEMFAPGDETLRGDGAGLLVGHESISAFRGVRGGVPPREIERIEYRPLADDLALLVQLLSVHPDLTGVGVDGDHRLLRCVGTALVGRHQRIGQGVEQRVDGNSLVARDLSQGVEEFEVGLAHGRFTLSLFFGAGPHSKTVLARSMSS